MFFHISRYTWFEIKKSHAASERDWTIWLWKIGFRQALKRYFMIQMVVLKINLQVNTSLINFFLIFYLISHINLVYKSNNLLVRSLRKKNSSSTLKNMSSFRLFYFHALWPNVNSFKFWPIIDIFLFYHAVMQSYYSHINSPTF